MEFIFDNNGSNTIQPMSMASSNTSSDFSIGTIESNPSVRRGGRRSLPESIDQIEITGTRPKRRAKTQAPKVDYLKTKKKKVKNIGASFEWTWQKFWWAVALIAFLRLILMENGVLDYYKVESSINENVHSLELLKQENAELVHEIHMIQSDARYQKKLARDHLGVIAPGEYLILFAQDSAQNSI